MKDSIRLINNLILEKYADHCNILRIEPKLTDINTFGEWEDAKALHWLNILNNVEFSTLSIEMFSDTSGVEYYAPVLIYSDGVDLVRDQFLVE